MPPSPPQIGLVLIAAGESSRMGVPKQLLDFRGQSLLRRAASSAVDSGLTPIVVVLGANSQSLAIELDLLPVQIALNTQWRRGMGSSIRIGMQALIVSAPQAAAAIVMLCDQPLVDSSVLLDLVAAYRETGKPIVASEYCDDLGVPALFDRRMFLDLERISDRKGAKRLIRENAANAHALPFAAGSCDIDTPDDYRRILEETEIKDSSNRSV